MKKHVDIRDHWEILGFDRGACNVVARATDAPSAIASYESVVERGGYAGVRIRHRHIVETAVDATPQGYTVVVTWTKDYEGDQKAFKFLTRAAAMAWASEGNDPKVMRAVHCVNNDTGETIYHWPIDE